MNDFKVIELDDFPHTLTPDSCYDFSSKIILSLLYERLFFKKNNEYHSRMVVEEVEGTKVKFFVKEFCWSNGEKLEIKDIYLSLTQIIKYSPLANLLNFIVGVKEYLYENKPISDIKLECVNNEFLQFKMSYDCDYKKIFSIIQFCPIKYGTKDTEVYSGPYKVLEFNEVNSICKLEYNAFYPCHGTDYLPKKIWFSVNKNLYEGIEKYFSGEYNMTFSTKFPFDEIEKMILRDDFFIQKSNILFTIRYAEELMYFKRGISNYLHKKCTTSILNEGIKLWNFIPEDNNFLFKKSTATTIKCLSPDYYPNNIICNYISKYLAHYNIEINWVMKPLKEYIEELSNATEEYQIIIQLLSPVVNSDLELFISLIPFFNVKFKKYYLKMINIYSKNKQKKLKIEILKYIQKYSNIFILGNINHIFLKDKELEFLKIDEDDYYYFDLNRGDQL